MEFEEMKKIWDTQNNEALYAINESALQRRIQAKKEGTKRTTDRVELLLIASNLISGGWVIISQLMKITPKVPALTMGGIMLAIGIYLIVLRLNRIKRDQQTDMSMLGDLDNALENIGYRIKLSQSMIWYCILIAAFSIFSVWNSDKSAMTLFLVVCFFIIGLVLSRWEHKRFHIGKRRQLMALKEKLTDEFKVG